MGIFVIILFALPGAYVTSWLLRDRFDALHIARALGAGMAVGILICIVLRLVLLNLGSPFLEAAVHGEIGWQLAAWIIFGGPIPAAVAAWRWRPRTRAAGDIRG